MRAMAKVLLICVGVAVSAMVSQPAAAGSLGYHYRPATFASYVMYIMSFLSGHDAAVKISGEAQASH